MPIDFSQVDPQAFFHGAQQTHALLTSAIRAQAGRRLAAGDSEGAVNTLQSSGDLEGANLVQDQGNQNLTTKTNEAVRQQGVETAQAAEVRRQRAEQAQFTHDAATALRHTYDAALSAHHSDAEARAAVMTAWSQLQPIFQHRGVDQQQIDDVQHALETDPVTFLDATTTHTAQELQRYQFTAAGGGVLRGDRLTGDNQEVYRAPHTVTLGSPETGQSVVETDPGYGVHHDGSPPPAPGGVPGPAAPPAPATGAPGLSTVPAPPAGGAAQPEQAPAPPIAALHPPVDGPLPSRPGTLFGPRARPTAGASTDHLGVDFSRPVGTPVTAAEAGTVELAGVDPHRARGLGTAVRIMHDDGTTETLYGHLSRVAVHEGQRVTAGQPIGLSGNTGITSGPNLHFGIYVNGVPQDPSRYLSGAAGGPATGSQGAAPAPGSGGATGTGRVIVSTPGHPRPPPPHADWRPMTPQERTAEHVPPDAMGWVDNRTGQRHVQLIPHPQGQGGTSPSDIPGPHDPRMSPQDSMRLRQLNTSLDQLTQVQGMLDQFETLNRSVETGGPMALPGVGMVAGAVNSQINRMNQISNALTPLMRNGLPGSVSDFEERMFRAATVSTDNPREANTQNIAMSRAWLERQQAFVEYMEAYANAHNTIRGARELWAHHVQHAPMFRANGSHVEVVPQPDWRDDPNLAASVGEGRHAAGEYHWNGHQLIETPAAGSQGGR